ncbi:hypothetical protein MNBD_GAMMA24-2301 [hydrothermal vent metagenome]|uniref:Calcineurin-like phosphoesterase domain-containing protein n=1 Tax=hydrothermal vent metagenome TaxID=652676 RepID=A0A3B1BEB5_9ZZZZ
MKESRFNIIAAAISFTLASMMTGQAMALSSHTTDTDNDDNPAQVRNSATRNVADDENNENYSPREIHKRHEKLKVALWGDEFYNDDPAKKLDSIKQTIKSMNKHELDFTLFAGDTKNGHSLCTDAAIGQNIVDIFNQINAPTLYSVGDNEWTDCHRISNGSYDPLERLAYVRKVFFSNNTSQGKHPVKVSRQGDLGLTYSENSRFVKSDVEFVALHIPGSNNNLVATSKQCQKKSNRTQADCDAATAEYRARNKKDMEWLKESFSKARLNDYAGIVIVIQADIFFPFELSDGGYQKEFLPNLDQKNGYSDFFNTLFQETHNYNGQVLLVHGDSHYFKIDKAMFNADGSLTRNFTRVEVFGNKDNSWVEMTVNPKSKNVFSFAPVILK